MSTDIVIQDGKAQFTPERYNAMRQAISACATIDDCAKAQSAAAALATYYHQINDNEAYRQLTEIRLRAWRKMAEIVGRVNVTKCATQKAMAAKVRDELGKEATAMLSDSRIIQLIKLNGVPERNFEAEVAKSTGSLDDIVRRAHPDAIKQREESERQRQDWERSSTDRAALEAKAAAKVQEREMQERTKRADAVIAMVKENAIMESPEVGLTLTPKAKASLVEFSVMMDRKMHDQLRDAAHERRTTMWAILREASNYWFVVNGYDKV